MIGKVPFNTIYLYLCLNLLGESEYEKRYSAESTEAQAKQRADHLIYMCGTGTKLIIVIWERDGEAKVTESSFAISGR